jgi:transcriptional regulator with XRE-family HTH domain
MSEMGSTADIVPEVIRVPRYKSNGPCYHALGMGDQHLGAGMGKRIQEPQDAEIGRRVRTLRMQRGLSQTVLADALGVTFQQVQKYEKGMNRISSGRLVRIAEILKVPIAFFFEGLEKNQKGFPGVDFRLYQTADTIRMMHAYSAIKDHGIRLKLVLLTEQIGE